MDIKVYALSHIGKVRDKNQDNYYCNGVIPDTENSGYRFGGSFSGDSPALFGVFDGMGGHLHGERASLYAVQACDALFSQYNGGNPFGVMNDICFSSNNRICEEMENVVKGRMGSTASMLLFENGEMFICNLGDSPIYLFRGGVMRQVSFEHTERHNYEQIFGNDYNKKKKFRLTQHLGIFPNEMELSPYNSREPLEPGDRFLICSDGVTDMVSAEEINSIVCGEKTVEKAAEKLLKTALDNGGKDNTTIIMGEICGKVPGVQAAKEPKNAYPQNMPPSMEYPESAPTQNDGYPAPDKKHRALLIVAIVLAVIAVAAAGLFVFKFMNNPGSDTENTTAAAPPVTTVAPTTENNDIGMTEEEEETIGRIKDSAEQAMDDLEQAMGPNNNNGYTPAPDDSQQ